MDFTVKYYVGFMSGMWRDVEAVKVESSKLSILLGRDNWNIFQRELSIGG